MFAKISKTVFAVAAIVMSIICAFNIWEIAGYILMGLGLLWFVVEAAVFARRAGAYTLAAVGALLVLGVGVWFPLSLVGMSLSIAETLIILGAIADAIALSFVWGK